MKFKVGDRVRAIGEVDGVDFTGRTGTVVRLSFGDFVIGVEFDKRTPSLCTQHSCNGAGKKGYCRWGCEREFELITPKNNKKIVITSDGVETLARLYDGNKVIKSATAKCSPDDEFDFETGAKIAFDRLVGNEKKPKYYSGKVVCVANDCRGKVNTDFTPGKVHDVVDGKIVDNKGDRRPATEDGLATLDDLDNRYFSDWFYKFIPFVE